jgi:formylglycine-generating enzyme required for sulfatase activity
MEENRLNLIFAEVLSQVRWGGSWDLTIGRFRADVRDRNLPEVKFEHLGIRLVRDQEETCNKQD